jgi:hypothetical protein
MKFWRAFLIRNQVFVIKMKAGVSREFLKHGG